MKEQSYFFIDILLIKSQPNRLISYSLKGEGMQEIDLLKKVFDHQSTDTLVFRPFSRSDCFPLYMASKNEKFNTNLWWGPPENVEEVLVEVDKILREHQLSQSLVLSVCEKQNGKWVGLVKYTQYRDSITMSLWIHPDYWKTGTAYRCVECAIDTIINNTELPHLYARIVKDYPIMEKMSASFGFSFVERDDAVHAKGHVVASNTYKLDRNLWVKNAKIEKY